MITHLENHGETKASRSGRRACLTRTDELSYTTLCLLSAEANKVETLSTEHRAVPVYLECLVFYLHESTLWKIHKSFAKAVAEHATSTANNMYDI